MDVECRYGCAENIDISGMRLGFLLSCKTSRRELLTPHGSRIASVVWLWLALLVLTDGELSIIAAVRCTALAISSRIAVSKTKSVMVAPPSRFALQEGIRLERDVAPRRLCAPFPHPTAATLPGDRNIAVGESP